MSATDLSLRLLLENESGNFSPECVLLSKTEKTVNLYFFHLEIFVIME